ncbi:PREDICTED: hemicentin-2 [Condylura cristata]|uniref:hemicentin-2 n=1 Tax=Condylura cristata TaxID=143302 RepID=UPI000642D115|nr:PREDICTED: hemicentin-2 [Condylura cristata]
MWDDLLQVMDGASRILQRSLDGGAVANFALVPFHDPDIGPVTLTADPAVFQRELRELYVQGGGDCPEMSVGAIKAAVEVANPGSFIYVFSDARAKDHHRTEELLRLLQLKQSQVVFVLTGDCGDRTHPGYLAYEEIAATSSGQVFHLDKQQVNEVLKWVESALQVSKVHLLSTDHEEEGEHLWNIPFDSSLKEVTISLSGPGPEIEVRDPLGRILQKDEGLNVLLSIPDSAKVVAFKPEHPGLWSIKVYSSGRHSVRITGVSNINFRAGFSTQPSLDLNHTIEWPLAGVPISLVINSTGLQGPGSLDSVELAQSSGQPLLTLPVSPLSNGSSHQLWGGPPFRAPQERFYLKVKGQDHEGNPLLRVSGVSYSGVAPGTPLVSMPPRIHGYLHQPLQVSCSVHSALPFRLQLRRDGARLGEERHLQGSGNSSWEIPRASKAEEGTYVCTAVSRAGTGHATAQIVITDPPPQLVPAPNVTVSPGETAVLSCWVLDEAPYNLTWVRDWRVLSGSVGRVTQLANLSLEVSGAVPSDGGRYQCMASNSNGASKASVWLRVREAPKVSIHARSQRFSQGVEMRVSCSASGYPAPHLSWSREGRALQEDNRIHVDAQGTLIIQEVAPEDAGNYSCQAANELGTDEETVTLYYSDPPKVSAVNAVVLAAVGEEAVLVCDVSGAPPPRVIWYRGGLEMILAPEDSDSGTLWIPTTRERDAGVYTCRAVNELGDASAEIRLEVGHAPQLMEAPRDVTVELGRSALLACRATGRPPPKVTWRRADGQPLGPRPGSRTRQRDSGMLFFESVSPEDQAPYICEAQNIFGKVQAEARLVVTGHVPPQIASSAATVRVLEGQPVSLPCVVLAGRPLPERRWLRAGGPLPPGGRPAVRADGSLHLDQALREDAGRYSCVVSNSAGSQQRGVLLVVQVPPRIQPTATYHVTNEGVPVSLPCVTSGVPKPTITWTKESSVLSPGGPHYNVSKHGALVITQPSVQDAGTYVCTATNAVGFSSQEMQLSVNTKPRILVNGSQDTDEPLRVVAKAGDEVTLDCEAQGSPPPLVTWTKDSRPVPPITDRRGLLQSGSLHLAQAQVGDSGLYRCTASNPAGSISRRYVLGVQVPPQVQKGPRVWKVLAGEVVDLNCAAEGTPEPQLEWSKDGAALQAGVPRGSVHFAAVQTSDAGLYRCEASSIAGVDAWELELRVLVPPSIREDEHRVNVTGMAGQPLTLECDASGFPAPEVVWLKDGQPLPHLGSHRFLDTLHLPSLQEGDSGLYSCRAENRAGTAQKDFALLVLIPPSVLGAGAAQEVLGRAGAEVQLECRAAGVPTPQVEWTKDGQPVLLGDPRVQLQEDGQVLRIASSHLGDEGRYQCVAFSPAGQQAKDFQLSVHSPPTIWGANETGEVAVVEGQPAQLLCEARGVPAPDIAWLKDGVPLAPHAEAAYARGVPPQLLVAEGLGQVTALVGQPLELPCQASGSPVPTIQWLQNGRPAEQLTGVQVAPQGTALQIEHVEPEHAGLFACQATNEAGTAGAEVELSVHELPSVVIVGGEDVTAPFLQPVTLRCEGTGVPPPSLRWWKDGVALAASGGSLQIEKVDLRDEGVYTCVATNPAGESSSDVALKVLVPPNIEPVPTNKAVLENTSVSLECLASGVPAPDISWFKGPQPVSTQEGVTVSGDGRVLLIERARFSDAGSYRCVASNVAGSTELRHGLRVNAPPRITLPPSLPGPVMLNAPVRLTCDASGAPSPTLMWLKDGNPVSPSGTNGLQVFPGGRVLTLASARVSDSGNYTCVAVSAVGEDRGEVTLQVHVPPSIQGEERNVSVVANESVALECRSHAVPPPVLSWRKDGRPLDPRPGVRLSADQAVLEVDRAEVGDAGRYTCEALNQAGRSEKHYNLHVWAAPAFPSREPLTLTVMEGHPARLSCDCWGVPFPKISWKKDGQPLPGEGAELRQVLAAGRLLFLGRARQAQGGTYTCQCSNAAGTSSQDQQLEVHAPPQITAPREPHTAVSVVQDGATTLECNATGNPPPRVTWERDGQPVGAEPGQRLRVERARAAQAGHYSCVAENAAGRAERAFSLSVLVPPEFVGDSEPLTNITVALHSPLTLLCEAAGTPPPGVRWFRGDEPLSPGEDTYLLAGGWMLKMTRAQELDRGLYSCLASNKAGEARRNFSVDVLVPPSIEDEDLEEAIRVPEGQSAHLACNATGHPQPTVTWFKDGRPLAGGDAHRISPDGALLQLLQANLSSAGHYSCVAANAVGEKTKHSQLSVLVPPSISKDDPSGEGSVKEVKAKANSTLTLECECWAAPPPAISWYKDGQPVTPDQRLRVLGDGRLLQIRPTRRSDSGRYLCVASNVAGEDDQDFSVLIQVPPMFQKVGDVGEAFELLSREEEARGGVTEYREVVENSPAYLYCDSDAVPPPTLTWYRGGRPLVATDGVSILQAPPVILGDTEELVEEVTVNASSTVRLPCPALGTPAPTISWLRNGLPFSPDPRLQVLEDGHVLQTPQTNELFSDAEGHVILPPSPQRCPREPTWARASTHQLQMAEAHDLRPQGPSHHSSPVLPTCRLQISFLGPSLVPPQIAGPSSEQVSSTRNSSVSLPCEVHAHPRPEVTWYNDGRALSLGEEVFLLPGSHTLQLARVQPSDAGTYVCEALNAAGRAQKLVQLSVLVPPTFRQAPGGPQDVVLVRSGDKAVLSCETDSHPEPAVTWFKDRQPVVPAQRTQVLPGGQRLEILDAQVSDKGLYSCKVSNAAGEATRTFILTVQVPPTFKNPKTEVVSQVAGSPLVLTCDVTGVPAPTVTWLRDRMPVESSVAHGVVSRGGRLQLSRLQPTQAGTYTCVAESAQAQARKDFVVAVLVAPRIRSSGATQEHSVLEGQEVQLDCEADGQPPPEVAWLKDGAPLGQRAGPHLRFYLDQGSLVLKGLRASDSGAYTCVAHNVAGEDARLHAVNVLVPPTIEQGAAGSGALVSRPGELVTMACPVRGSPPIHVSWLKDGLPLPLSQRAHLHGHGRTLRISPVQLADSGTFTCLAASPAGVTSRNFSLQVHEPPVLEPVEFQEDLAVARGSPLLLPCEARGSPLPLVSWMKDGEPWSPQSPEQGPGLRLEAVGAGDSGTYSCVATNEAGEARRRFQLTVMDPPYIEDSGQSGELSLTPGTPLELPCDAQGTPQPNITWHKDGQALNWTENGHRAGRVLRVDAVQVGDAGLYTCLAQNPVGDVEKSFRVRVQAPPSVLGPRGPRSVVGLAPGQLVLECTVEAETAPEIEWHRDGVLLQADAHTQFPERGRFLQLQALSLADGGDYGCTARNAAGSTSVAFHVEIHMVPTIRPGPAVVNASVSQTALLPCQADGAPLPLMSWRKDGAPLDPENPRLQVLPEGSLRIQPVLPQDAGRYLCLASNSAGSDRQGRDLRVFEPPAVAPSLSNLTLTAHTPASLPCEASGSPKPLVVWWKDGQTLDFHLQQGAYRLLPSNALLLTAPGPQDAGQFECVVSNEAGEARRLFLVTVHVPPTIADDQTEFTVTKMAPVVLTCHSSGVPAPAVSWAKAGTPLGVRGSGHRVLPSGALEIGQALPIHAGRYTCTARNAAGIAHKHVALTVQAPPVVRPLPGVLRAVAEEEVLLPCEALGLPRPSVTWQKEGLRVAAGAGVQVLRSGHLRLVRVSPDDAGNYFCVAQNSVGSALGRTRLVVQVPPKIETGLADLSTIEGSHALLPCTASGSPQPDITWEKDGQPVSGVEGKFIVQPSGELLVKDSESQDAGTYTCTAENAVGRARRRVHLTILALPVFTTLPGDRSLRLGDRLWLRCAARGSPTPRIGWTVNDRLVTEGVSEQDGGSTLQRVAVTREDSGTYVCWAENRVGRVQALSFVHVKEPPVLQGEAFSYLVEPVGGSIRLDCVVRGDPAPDIRWLKDGLPLRGGRLRHRLQNGSLTIRRTERSDAGRYQCLARGELGAVEKVVLLVLQSAPVFQVAPQDVAVSSGDAVALPCQAEGEPAPSIQWLRAGQPLRAGRRLRTLPDGSLWLERAEAGDAGAYECVAHNALGSATARAVLAVRDDPRGSWGSMTGVINGQGLGVAALNTSVQRGARAGATTVRSSITHVPASVGPLMRVLVVTIAPVYWALAGESGDALNGHSLTGGSFRQESHVEFATGELLTMTQVARGLDPDGLLLLDVEVAGNVPESLAAADLQVQDFQERYVQTGPGQLFVGATQGFLQDGLPAALRCNHSVQYDAARGPQPQLVQHLQASAVRSDFDPEAQALHFQLTAALQAEENEVGCPEGFELDAEGEFCVDRDECSDDPSPCSHSCYNTPGHFSCTCPAGFTLAKDDRSCRDVDECLEQSDECHHNQLCENTPGGHRCGCLRGYRTQGPGLPCLDINECLQLPPPCTHQCHNLQGTYRCLCPPGQTLLPDGQTCTPLGPSRQNVTTVSFRGPWLRPRAPVPGGPHHAWVSRRPSPRALGSAGWAGCPPGFIRQNGACTDLDECRAHSLCQHACRNTEGSYRCLCPAGYRLLPSGRNCQDINECQEDGIECGPGQMCFNTRGSYQCVHTPCPATYRQGSSPGTCFRRCSQDCGARGPSTLQYKLLPLPLGVRAHHDVARLAAFSEAGVPANRTELSVLEPDPQSPFALRPLRAGLGAVYTRRALTRAGLYRLTVRAAAPRHQSVYVLLISVSPYPY